LLTVPQFGHFTEAFGTGTGVGPGSLGDMLIFLLLYFCLFWLLYHKELSMNISFAIMDGGDG
jgi:hypothetical protein